MTNYKLSKLSFPLATLTPTFPPTTSFFSFLLFFFFLRFLLPASAMARTGWRLSRPPTETCASPAALRDADKGTIAAVREDVQWWPAMDWKSPKAAQDFPTRFLAIQPLDRRDSTWNQLPSSSGCQPYPDRPLEVVRKIPRFRAIWALKLDFGQSVVSLKIMIPDFWSWCKMIRNDIYIYISRFLRRNHQLKLTRFACRIKQD